MNLYKLTLIPLFSALTAAGSFIRIPIAPVPITLQNFFVIMCGILLGPRAGALSQIIYLLIGLIGLPVFSGGGGLSYIMKPSFGYLLGFVCASAVSGYIMKGRPFTVANIFMASAIGMLTIYLVGTPYLAGYFYYIMDKPDAIGIAIKTGMLLFIPGDLLKCLVLALILPKIGQLGAIRKG